MAPLTTDQFRQLRDAVQGIPERQRLVDGLRADLQTFVQGGALSERLAEQLRPRISTQVGTRLDAMQAEIDADVAKVKKTIPDYDPTKAV